MTTLRASASEAPSRTGSSTVTSRLGSSTERFTSVVDTIRVFGTKIAATLVRGERRVAERDLVDDARVVVDGDAIAEADRLGEREQHARAEVAERSREGESGDDGEHGTRGEECARDLLRRREHGEDAPQPDEGDERDHEAQEEAERRAASRSDSGIPFREPALVAVERVAEGGAYADEDEDPDEP